jgi:hypothetical protein
LDEFHQARTVLVIVSYMVDPPAHWIAPHPTGIVGLQQFGNCRNILYSGVEPQIVLSGSRITGILSWTAEVKAFGVVVKIAHVRNHCPSHSSTHPTIRKREQLALAYFEAVRVLGCARLCRLVKAICGNQTSAELELIMECRLRRGCLRFRVDRVCRDGRVFRPVWNETPLHRRNPPDWFLRILPDYWNGLRRGDVESRRPVVPRSSLEIPLDELLPARQSIATAHAGIMADRNICGMRRHAKSHSQVELAHDPSPSKVPGLT